MANNRDFIKEVVILALPIGFQSLINNLVNMIDSIMIGSLGEASITAVTVSGTFLWLAITFIMGISNAASIIAAQDYGKNNLQRIKKLLSFMIVISIIISIIFFAIIDLFSMQIIKMYTNIDSAIKPGCDYLNIMKYSLIFNMVTQAIITILRSVRSVKLGLYNSILSCFFNVFFNWIFIYGHLGFSAMGVAGAAIGTLIARIIEFIVSICYLLFFEKNLNFRMIDFNICLDRETIIKLSQITIPLLIIDVLTNVSSSVQTMITGRISSYYISANSIVHNAWLLPNVFMSGISMAATIMVGNSIGEKNFLKAKEDSKRFIVASFVFGLFGGVMVQVILPILTSFYNVSFETVLLTKQMGYSASISVFFLGFSNILCNGVIKAGGKVNHILKINIISTWLIAIPFGYLGAFVFHLPTALIYLILRSGNIIKTIWAFIQLKKDNWITII